MRLMSHIECDFHGRSRKMDIDFGHVLLSWPCYNSTIALLLRLSLKPQSERRMHKRHPTTQPGRLNFYDWNHKNDALGKVFLPSILTEYSKIPSSVAINLKITVNAILLQKVMRRSSQISAVFIPSDSHSDYTVHPARDSPIPSQ